MLSYFAFEMLANDRHASLQQEAAHERFASSARHTDSTPLRLRLADTCDRVAVLAFLNRLSPATLNARYLSPLSRLTGDAADREVKRLLDGDSARHVVVVAEDGAQIRGLGEFVAETATTAELAMVVEDDFQDRGIGQMLYRRLEELAREHGVTSFTGDVQHGNARVLSLMRRRRAEGACLQHGLATVRFCLPIPDQTRSAA